jgi:hypothetical protein
MLLNANVIKSSKYSNNCMNKFNIIHAQKLMYQKVRSQASLPAVLALAPLATAAVTPLPVVTMFSSSDIGNLLNHLTRQAKCFIIII